jgi:hypothetical protein
MLKLTTIIVSDFLSRNCKMNNHNSCHGRWSGLGFEIVCDCKCGHNKKGMALELVGEPEANTIKAISSTPQERIQRR